MRHCSKKIVAAAFFSAAAICLSGISVYAEDKEPDIYREPALSGVTRTWVYAGDDWDETVSRNRIFADDLEDGDLTTKVIRTGTIDTEKPGTYRLTYTITDSDQHTTSMETTVNVLEKGDTSEKLVQRKLYTLGSASHLTSIGFNRGYYHDRQSLGFYLPAGGELEIRLVNADEFGKDLNIGFYNLDQEHENRETIPASGEWVTLSNSYGVASVPFIQTPKENRVQPELEYKWTDELKEIPYYRYGDDEDRFFDRWSDSQAPFAILEGSAATFLVPIKDKDNIVNSSYTRVPEYRFQSIDEMLEWYADFVKQYDEFAGLDFYADEPYNQNIRGKFFIKANVNGAGAAYYGSDHSAFNGDSLQDYLTRSWLSLHEFGHGYEGAIATQENSFVETTNNIMGHYFEKTYRPATEFGWLMGDSNEPTMEERLATLEKKSLARKKETSSFNGIVAGAQHYQVSLHMFTNALDRIGPKNTVSRMHESYRKYYYENKKMRGSSDAVVESFSKSGYNMVPYFETYHIKPSIKVENEIYEADDPILYYLYDLVLDEQLATQIRKKLNLPGVYCLVETDDLAYTGYKSQVEFQIQIDDLEQVRNKNLVIKNGKQIVKSLPITSETVRTELPIGAYEVELPAPNAAAYAYGNTCLIASKGNKKQEITYRKITGNALADDLKLMLHGMSDGLFAYVTVDTSAEKLTWHTLAIEPHFYYTDMEYAGVRIFSPSGEELYSQTIIGDKLLEEDTKELDFPIGSRIVITHDEGHSRMRMMSTNFGDKAVGYEPSKGENAYVMTKYGLMQESWDESKRENVYLSCLNQYSQNAASEMNGALLQNPEKFHQEKMVIQNAYQSLSEEKKAEYDKKWGIFTGQNSIPTYRKIPSGSMTGKADSEEGKGENGPGSWAVDGNEDTFWHSNYSGSNDKKVNFEEDKNTNYTITLSENMDIGKLEYVPRKGGGNGTILTCELYYSESSNGDDFKKISHPEVLWVNNGSVKSLEFDAVNARRIRIHVTSAANGNFISASEFYLYEKKEISINDTDIYLGSLADGMPEAGTKAPQKDANGNGKAISLIVNGAVKTFSKGVGMRPRTAVTYDIEGKNFDIFAAYAGVDNETAKGKAAWIQIYGDDALIYESGRMESGDFAKALYIDISGRKKLKIVVTGDEGALVSLGDARFYLTRDKDNLKLMVGETARLTANNSLDLTGAGMIQWESDHEEIATVDAVGNITGAGIGEAVISAFQEGWDGPRIYQVEVIERKTYIPPNEENPEHPENPEDPDISGITGKIAKTTGLAVGGHTTKSLTLTWSAASGADGYEIYRAPKNSGAFEMIQTVNATSYTDGALAGGTDYTYKVRAYSNQGNAKGEFSDEVWSTTKPSKTTIKKVKKSGSKATVQWKKNKQAQGYEIWMKQKGAFKKIKNVSAKKTSVKSGKLKKGKKYIFKVRAYRMDGANQKIYGAFSKTKKLKM